MFSPGLAIRRAKLSSEIFTSPFTHRRHAEKTIAARTYRPAKRQPHCGSKRPIKTPAPAPPVKRCHAGRTDQQEVTADRDQRQNRGQAKNVRGPTAMQRSPRTQPTGSPSKLSRTTFAKTIWPAWSCRRSTHAGAFGCRRRHRQNMRRPGSRSSRPGEEPTDRYRAKKPEAAAMAGQKRKCCQRERVYRV